MVSARQGELGGEVPTRGNEPISLAGSARSLLLTVFGELVGREGAPVWTAALLHVLTGLGLEEQTARQAIARGAGAGWITGEKRGREVRWSLTDAGADLIEDVRSRAESLGSLADVWDGNCLILITYDYWNIVLEVVKHHTSRDTQAPRNAPRSKV